MLIFKSSKTLYSHFLSEIMADLPTRIFILTYGAWCGINKIGCTTNNLCTTYRLLDYLNDNSDMCRTTIVIGYDNIVPPSIIETAKRFKCLEFLAVNYFHSKCILTSSGILSVGSSNLTDSTWFELNLYNHMDVQSEEYLDIHNEICKICNDSGEILTSTTESVDITELIRRNQ